MNKNIEVFKLDNSSNAKLTSAEIAALWTQYINETASMCIHKHMMEHLKDNDIRSAFEYAMSLSTKHIEKIKEFFRSEGYPIPIGFKDNDYTPNAPRLFSDILCLKYLNIMSLHGCHGYSGAITTCTRLDVRNYFTECNASAVELCNRTKDIMLEKGVYHRPPVVNPPDSSEYVDDNNYLTGWFGEKRALSCVELTNIYFNSKKSTFAKAFVVAAHQVAKSDKVKNFLLKAIKMAEENIKMFNEVLLSENVPSPPIYDAEITDSTVSPFSEKLLMFQIGFLTSTAMIYYGTGLAFASRRDLSSKYMMAIMADLKISNDWIHIMIKNRWLEQPPLVEDR
ncbi:DUF3231 family protein [Neobacillus drentensis]|uniref:DUF3231 family protein n=1 Tax=Neobacillus drentensis TaxID=220684 RepID=UPI0008251F85|nr:DUF3231 family protein [Neobacillus drentensis]